MSITAGSCQRVSNKDFVVVYCRSLRLAAFVQDEVANASDNGSRSYRCWYILNWYHLKSFNNNFFIGMTSEGGGAVAFPFMTLGLHIEPTVARDFSLMMQSVEQAVVFGTLGSIPGLICGFKYLDPQLTAPQKKMLFVSIWASFAIALFILNSQKKRKTYKTIPEFRIWKAAVLSTTGFVGGIFTAFAGSGVDICIFSVITLLFRVTEKTATPTTVVLMGEYKRP
uniref:Membrane transporter protein n=1 Tax=Heterorhabditis bacteriophora TaxID=37862 RepID=A0A1I7W9L0_HETBA